MGGSYRCVPDPEELRVAGEVNHHETPEDGSAAKMLLRPGSLGDIGAEVLQTTAFAGKTEIAASQR